MRKQNIWMFVWWFLSDMKRMRFLKRQKLTFSASGKQSVAGSWSFVFCFLFFSFSKLGKKIRVQGYCLGSHVFLLLCAHHQPLPWAHLMHSCVTAKCEPLQWVIFFRMKCDIVRWCCMYGSKCICVIVCLYSWIASPLWFMLNISVGLAVYILL